MLTYFGISTGNCGFLSKNKFGHSEDGDRYGEEAPPKSRGRLVTRGVDMLLWRIIWPLQYIKRG
jgi:hypothetical protein